MPDVTPSGSAGGSQIVVVVDNFSKFVMLGSLPDRRADTVALWFYQQVICLFGAPVLIKSDGGSEFKGMFDEMCEELKVKHHTTLPYHPQANGIAERFVRTVKSYLIRYLVTNEPASWEGVLPPI